MGPNGIPVVIARFDAVTIRLRSAQYMEQVLDVRRSDSRSSCLRLDRHCVWPFDLGATIRTARRSTRYLSRRTRGDRRETQATRIRPVDHRLDGRPGFRAWIAELMADTDSSGLVVDHATVTIGRPTARRPVKGDAR